MTEQHGTKPNGKTWTRYSIKVANSWYSTFDTRCRDMARSARAADAMICVDYAVTPFGRDIVQVAVVMDQGGVQ